MEGPSQRKKTAQASGGETQRTDKPPAAAADHRGQDMDGEAIRTNSFGAQAPGGSLGSPGRPLPLFDHRPRVASYLIIYFETVKKELSILS
jgi:hypothetical protein